MTEMLSIRALVDFVDWRKPEADRPSARRRRPGFASRSAEAAAACDGLPGRSRGGLRRRRVPADRLALARLRAPSSGRYNAKPLAAFRSV